MPTTTKKRTAVLISGNGSNLQALIDASRAADYPTKISLVISNKAEAFGLERAKNAGIATEVLSHLDFPDRTAFDEALNTLLLRHAIEYVCLAGFMRLLTPDFTTRWEGRMLNIHPSLLPAFKGLNTHARALECGVKFTGCTVHFVVPEMDAGPIIIQAAVPILEGDTPESLAARVHHAEHLIYPKALHWLASGKLAADGHRVSVEGHHSTEGLCINPS